MIAPTLERLRRELLQQRHGRSHWTGELSASALSTATAISALSLACRKSNGSDEAVRYRELVRGGSAWLRTQQNADGGYGDTDRSHSNIATSYLVLAAQKLAAETLAAETLAMKISADPKAADAIPDGDHNSSDERLRQYLDTAGGIPALRRRYGTDKTFVVPILTNMAIAGLVPWSEVSALPFEAAVFPQSMYRFLGMPVVSYAVPALVAIGQAKFLHDGTWPPWSWVRRAAIAPSLRVLRQMQPDSGGYLEATPLTSFVLMSLLDTDRAEQPVVAEGLKFLVQSSTPENEGQFSWPIDTNLATWVTSLSVQALTIGEGDRDFISDDLVDWILSCQHNVRHPFTGADPGGWGWTDLSGAVPDADDTPGAMIALMACRTSVSPEQVGRIDEACRRGAGWLLGLQNRDGGWPTFCRGWGKLPFDRSSVDLTAHAIRALRCLEPAGLREAMNTGATERAIGRGLEFLRRQQQPDGSWLPLWFGNQDRPDEDNPVYGTAKVLVDVDPALGLDSIVRGIEYLVDHQNADGGWGGGPSVAAAFGLPETHISTVEETALAVDALASFFHREADPIALPISLTNRTRDAILLGGEWLVRAVADDRHQTAWPIGFYFAKLWYHERLYPPIFALAALSRLAKHVQQTDASPPSSPT
ncbi:prenyltransferase/squalene oxidase repeat-containing protein [Neorhodopirellula pilleata]|uniref:Sporulenol synthase n=1 Tax=Neorhodopirellula pilleata TaxID=2714738 RepID=A0A5C6A359_9BACT|nr:prenyltransferase/squalene oxidase repeat-containing protein [Neorhodopirellula pilleata]TWT93688.1 Sporulenol synthase [Neorhodopirellula pilleata]